MLENISAIHQTHRETQVWRCTSLMVRFANGKMPLDIISWFFRCRAKFSYIFSQIYYFLGEQKAAIRTNSASRVHFGDFSTYIAQSVTIHARIINAVFHSTVIAQIGAQYLVLLALVLLPSVLYTKQFDTVSLQRP